MPLRSKRGLKRMSIMNTTLTWIAVWLNNNCIYGWSQFEACSLQLSMVLMLLNVDSSKKVVSRVLHSTGCIQVHFKCSTYQILLYLLAFGRYRFSELRILKTRLQTPKYVFLVITFICQRSIWFMKHFIERYSMLASL